MGKILKAVTGDFADSFVAQLFTPSDEVWVSLDVWFDAGALAVWELGFSGDFVDLFTAFDLYESVYISDQWVAHDANTGDYSGSPPAPTAGTWHTLELHWTRADSADWYLDGPLIGSADTTPDTDQLQEIRVGLYEADLDHFETVAVYIDNVKVGTTRGGTDLFADDFESGDFSAWDSTSGDVSIIDDSELGAADFTLEVTPDTLTFPGAGGMRTASTDTAAIGGDTEAIALSFASAFPAGIDASISPGSITAGDSSVLTVTVDPGVAYGTYTRTLQAVGDDNTHTVDVTVVVAPPDFSIAATPDTVTFSAPGTQTIDLETSALFGDTETIALSLASAFPAEIAASISPASITAGGSATLTITVSPGIVNGTYVRTVQAVGDDNTHTANVAVIINGPATGATDTISSVVQLGTDLERYASNGVNWKNADPADQTAHLAWLTKHEGDLYVAHCDPNGSGVLTGPYVDRWDGSAWVAVGGGTSGAIETYPGDAAPNQRNPARPIIVSGAGSLWLAYTMVKGATSFDVDHSTFQRGLFIRRWNGSSWELKASYWLSIADSYSGGVFSQVPLTVEPESGIAYAGIRVGFSQIVLDSTGAVTDCSAFLPGSEFFWLMADGGTPLIVTRDAGPELQVYDLGGSLLASAAQAAVSDEGTGTLDALLGDPAFHIYRDGSYYLVARQEVVQIPADGSAIGPLFGNTHYSGIRPDGGNAAKFDGSVMWDEGDGTQQKLWYVDAPGAYPFALTASLSSIFVFQNVCPLPIPAFPRDWFLVDLHALPQDSGTDASRSQYGQATSVYLDGKIYTCTILDRASGPAGNGNPFWNGHVQVYESTICRGCADCPHGILGGLTLQVSFRAEPGGGAAAAGGDVSAPVHLSGVQFRAEPGGGPAADTEDETAPAHLDSVRFRAERA